MSNETCYVCDSPISGFSKITKNHDHQNACRSKDDKVIMFKNFKSLYNSLDKRFDSSSGKAIQRK